jgi:rRNA maturation endonuclease Nob1
MTENSSASNFDNYIADLHENLDRLRDISDVDEQSSTIIADLAQAYSEHPSPMQTGDEYQMKNCSTKINLFFFLSYVFISFIFWSKKYSDISSTF